MTGIALLPIAALFGIGPIGRFDVGFSERAVPGAVAIGAEEIAPEPSEGSQIDVATERAPEATVVAEAIGIKTADIGLQIKFVAAVATTQLRFEAKEVACMVTSTVDGALHHELRLE